VISWVADHRKHHAFSDRPGDPHSPHVDHGSGWSGALRGLAHAHVGWLFSHETRGRRTRYAPDLLADPVVSRVDRAFVPIVAAGLIIPFFLGWAFGGTLRDGLTGLLWGGAVRVLVLHHSTYAINSLCHFFGRRRFGTKDESRNLAWLSVFTFGEAWHNNHHAFPTSAQHGLRRWEFDRRPTSSGRSRSSGSCGTSCGSRASARRRSSWRPLEHGAAARGARRGPARAPLPR
jgi:stearoyl-CoA desaturase (delta-9 desaturase)